MINKRLAKLIRSLEQKKYRRQEGLFVAEGPKVVGDLMRISTPRCIIATPDWMAGSEQRAEGTPAATTEVVQVSEDELRRVSFLQHPQKVMALFPLPDSSRSLTAADIRDKLCIALDGVQDPGNMGTIIRIADWFGIDTLLCSHDTADAYNPQVVQATMGSIARVNIIYTDLCALFDKLPDAHPVYGTLLDGNNIYEQPLTDHGIIVMGNEGKGISPAIRERVTRRLLIPHFGKEDGAESLNVAIATAITCSEFRRRQATS